MLHPHHHHALMLFIVLLFSSLNYSQSLTTHGDDERGILLSLKQQYWGNPSSLKHWDSTSSPCDWPYISCNSNGSVTVIYLSGMNLQGSFPSKIICQLNNLSSIYLGMNNLGGTIPIGLSTCSKLQELDLSDRLSQLHQLSHLSLSFNKMNGEIPGKLELFSLNDIDLSHNHLSGTIPRGFGELLNLEYINVSHNHLSGDIWLSFSPLSASHLSGTLILDICSNNLSGRIPYKQLKERFEHSFFDGANLCSDVKENGLPACSTEWCSDYIACSSKPFRRPRLACVFKLVRSRPRLKPLLHVAAVTTPALIPATVPPPPSPSILVTQSHRLLIGQKCMKNVLHAIVLNLYYSELAAICISGGVVKGMIWASTSWQNLEN